ncbi:hypothetical protein [Bradyrhizobium sp. CCBAU 45384]|uniref:hypothetical protein n=1 Tax=Bradyrhizobium sp. CCBAU 45384 TaxID=858428 RepID=UPI0023054EB8|nr:hypothetical protein [Bradyrhizobium sp. CCBAU 45384]
MKFEAALQAQQDVFDRAFGYTKIEDKAGVFFANPQAIEAAERGETIAGPAMLFSIGIGPSSQPARHGANREFELVVYCQDKKQLSGPITDKIRRMAAGEVRIVYIGRIRKTSWQYSMTRPLRMGCSVGHRVVTAGTLGARVTLDNGQSGILSCNHVLANVNQAAPGDAIVQPGKSDGGKDPTHRVATLHSFERINFAANSRNFVDAAVASLLPGMNVDASVYEGNSAIGLCKAQPEELFGDESVMKVGRTTGLTRGRVVAVNVNHLYVPMMPQRSQQLARFDGQIAIEGAEGAFSRGGDSGALVMNEALNPVGLCFASSQVGGSHGLGFSFANPIGPVLSALNCSIAVA